MENPIFRSSKLPCSFREPQRTWSRRELLDGLERGQFVPYFQPKVELCNRTTHSIETLVRWAHPTLGLLRPVEFVAQIEAAGLLDRLTEVLLRQLLDSANTASRCGLTLNYAINVSALTMQKPKECDRFRALVREHAVPPEQITLELIETAAAKDIHALTVPLTRFRNEGFGISADDFGTGYSTLEQLSLIPFTEVKVDRAFVAGVFHSTKCKVILRSIIALASQLGMRTVAEGIETPQQLSYLIASGCHFGQGFLLGMPMPHADLINYLEREVRRVA